jgi:hypothetical protein
MHFGSGLRKRFGLGAEIKWNEKIPHRQVKNFPGKKHFWPTVLLAASNIKRARFVTKSEKLCLIWYGPGSETKTFPKSEPKYR